MYAKVYIINPAHSTTKGPTTSKVKVRRSKSKKQGAATMAKAKAKARKHKAKTKAAKKKAVQKTLRKAIKKANRTLAILRTKAATVGLPITEKNYRPHASRKRKSPVPRSRFMRRLEAKRGAGGLKKSFRPRLYIYKGRVYGSPLSDADMEYRVNPRKGSMRRKRRRSSKLPAFLRGRKNPSRRRRYRRNPMNIKSVASKGNFITAVAIGGGFIVGIKATKFITKIPFLSDGWGRRLAGIAHVLLGGAAMGLAKKDAIKKVGMGIMGAGFYDLASRNIPQIGLMPLEGVDLDIAGDYALVGETADVAGDYALVGETADVSGDDVVMVGDDDDMMGDDGIFARL